MRLFLLSILTISASVHAATPVLVELFTSEGCSSCPPADRLLGTLHRDQPVPGIDIIVLSEHVDYWDYIGWKDPFASRLFTDRQRSYSGLIHPGDGFYTPQMIVDGRYEFVGSDERRALSAIQESARRPKLSISGTVEGHRATVQLPANDVHSSIAVYVAVFRKDASSSVLRGENRGRELHHVNVVVQLAKAGLSRGKQSWSGSVDIGDYDPVRDGVICFAQRTDTREIVAVAELQR